MRQLRSKRPTSSHPSRPSHSPKLDVPHNPLIAPLARDNRPRNHIAGYRFASNSLATLMVAGALPDITGAPDRATRLLILAATIAVAATATLLLAWYSTRGYSAEPGGDRRKESLGVLLRVIADRDTRILLAIVALTGFAPPLFSKGLAYLATYVIGVPEVAGAILAGQAGGQLLAVLGWIWIASRREKALALSHGLTGPALLLTCVMAPRDSAMATLVGGLVGIGISGVCMLP